jgi:hypothetical protein
MVSMVFRYVARAMFDVLVAHNRVNDGEGSDILLLTRHKTYPEQTPVSVPPK